MARIKLTKARKLDLGLLVLLAVGMLGLSVWVYWPFIMIRWDGITSRYADWRQSAKSVSELVADMESVNMTTRVRARTTLFDITDATVIPELIKHLNHEDASVREMMATALGRFGPRAKSAIPNLVQAAQDESDKVRSSVAMAVGRIDPNADGVAPAMVELLGDESSTVRLAAAESLRLTPNSGLRIFTDELANKNPSVRKNAARELATFGPTAQVAVPALARLLEDPDASVRASGALTLGRIGPPANAAIPALCKAVDDQDAETAKNSVEALGKMRENTTEVVAALKRGLARDHEPIRLASLHSLNYLHAEVLPELMALLRDESTAIRSVACSHLQRFGPRAGLAVPELARLLKDANSDVRRSAVWALRAVGDGAKTAIPDLIGALRDPDLVYSCAMILENFGTEAQAAVPVLMELLKDPRLSNYAIAHALRRLSPTNADRVVPDLIADLNGTDKGVRLVAAKALGGIETRDKAALDALIKAIKDDDVIRYDCLIAIQSFGPDAKAAVPALTELLMSKAPGQSFSKVIHTLSAIGPAARDAVPALLDVLERELSIHSTVSTASTVVLALGRIGPASDEVIQALLRSYEICAATVREEYEKFGRSKSPGYDSAVWVACNSQWALAEVGCDPKVSLTILSQATSHPEPNIRVSAFLALGRVGAEARESIPVLIEALRDSNASIRTAAARGLGGIGPDARAALPALVEAINDKQSLPTNDNVWPHVSFPTFAQDLYKLSFRDVALEAIRQIDPAFAPQDKP